jgi:hypothetical protein
MRNMGVEVLSSLEEAAWLRWPGLDELSAARDRLARDAPIQILVSPIRHHLFFGAGERDSL